MVGIDVNKILVSKTEQYGAKHLNSLLDIMILMLLGHYVWDFHKWLTMLKNLKKMRQCLF